MMTAEAYNKLMEQAGLPYRGCPDQESTPALWDNLLEAMTIVVERRVQEKILATLNDVWRNAKVPE